MRCRAMFFLGLLGAIVGAQEPPSNQVAVGPKSVIDVADCVRIRRLFDGQVEISPDGHAVAYVVKVPDVDTNKNMYQLYIRDIDMSPERRNGRVLLESDDPVYGLKWNADGKKLILLDRIDKEYAIAEINPMTANRKVLLSSSDPISSFSVSSSSEMIVYSTEPQHSDHPLRKGYIDHGYPVIFGQGLQSPDQTRADPYRTESVLFVARLQADGNLSSTNLKDIGLNSLKGITGLSLSPDGRYLVFSYRDTETPTAWQWIPVFRWNPVRLGIFDFRTNTFRIAFDSPLAEWGLPVAWAMDSQAFTLNALAPSKSMWQERDREQGFTDGAQYKSYYHTFAVDLRTNNISEVVQHPHEFYATQVVYWKSADSKMLLRKNDSSYGWFEPGNPEWKEVSESTLSLREGTLLSELDRSRINTTSDGKKVVGVYERTAAAPDIFVHELPQNRSELLTDLNPQFPEVAIQPVETVKWRDRFGFENRGLLIKPPGYDSARRYPLVIMVKEWLQNHFIADTSYQTAFAPLPLATAGFVVLMAPDVDRGKVGSSPAFRKYPGRMGEYIEFEAIVESAINMLVQRGLAERDNVGITGFSSSSWETDILLTHSTIPFVAASSADSGLWNYSLYWNTNSKAVMSVAEEQMGGPPYGKTFRNWLQFAPAFNAEHLTTPLLMEYTDRGAAFDPDIDGMEFFVALSKQNKPVDLFFYPHGSHLLDSPYQRIASLQRNVDWFRFWMQGYEGATPPYDPEQYVRWKRLKALYISSESAAVKKQGRISVGRPAD